MAGAERADELVREGLAGRATNRESRIVGEQQVGDRAEQVRLADAGRPAYEERVVRLRWHLRDGEGGGVRKPVAVSDHELIERQLRVGQWWSRRKHALGSLSRAGTGAGTSCGGGGGIRGRARAAPRVGVPLRAAPLDQLDAGTGAEDELDAGGEDLAEAIADPAAGVGRGFDEETVPVELQGTQRLEPDVVGGLVYGEGDLGLHPRPYVLELGAHGSVDPLLSQRK